MVIQGSVCCWFLVYFIASLFKFSDQFKFHSVEVGLV